MMKTIHSLFALVALSLLGAQEAAASTPSITGNALGDGILSTIIYSAIGIIMAVVSYKVIDIITPGDLSKDIAENNNQALATLAGLTVLGICIIIAAVLAS